MIATTTSKRASANGSAVEDAAHRRASSGRRARTNASASGEQVDADDRAVLGEPRAVAARAAAGVEDPLVLAREPGREQVGHERTGVAVPPVVVLGRGDARVLLDLHRGTTLAIRPDVRCGRSAGEAKPVDRDLGRRPRLHAEPVAAARLAGPSSIEQRRS